MSAIVIEKPQDILGMAGTSLGPTDWLVIDQDRVDKFADATNDHQWCSFFCIAHGHIIKRCNFTRWHMPRKAASGTVSRQIFQSDIGKSAPHHHLMIAAARAK